MQPRRHAWLAFLLPAAVCLFPSVAASVSIPTGFQDEAIITGLSQPSGFARLPDGRVFIIEQMTGRVRLFVNQSTSSIPLTVSSLTTGNERGLLAIAVDPQWPTRPYIYLFHTRTGNRSRLVRYTASGDLTNGSSTNVTLGTSLLLLDDLLDNASNHNGGALRFGTDGCLYLSLGDDADRCAAQDSTTLKGAILRMWVNNLGPSGGGPVTRAALTPTDNPLVTTNANAKLVYAYGLRNPFRFHIDPETDLLYVADVGEATWEEISEVGPGDNLGWPHREGYAVVSVGACPEPGGSGSRGYTPPIQVLSNTGSAIMSAGVYRAPAQGTANWPAEYRGSAFYSEYYDGILRRLVKNGNGQWVPAPIVPGQPSSSNWGTGFISAVDFEVAPDGSMWWIRQFNDNFEGGTGSLRRLRYNGPTVDVPTPGAAGLALAAAPNPFRGTVALSFRLEQPQRVRLALHDLSGRLVRVLHDGDAAGEMRIAWDGIDGTGRAVAPGVYLAKLDRDGASESVRVLRLK
jgi:glucose/arabinose dehydrogenase